VQARAQMMLPASLAVALRTEAQVILQQTQRMTHICASAGARSTEAGRAGAGDLEAAHASMVPLLEPLAVCVSAAALVGADTGDESARHASRLLSPDKPDDERDSVDADGRRRGARRRQAASAAAARRAPRLTICASSP